MSLKFKVWAYGTRASKAQDKSKKKLVRLPDGDYRSAKRFHIFFQPEGSKEWIRITDETVAIPSDFRSKIDKEFFVSDFVSNVEEVLRKEMKPKKVSKKKVAKKKVSKKVSKKVPTKKIPKEKVVEPVVTKPVEKKPLTLPPLPSEPRVTLTKPQFEAQMRRIIFDEVEGRKLHWPKRRIENLITKLWKNFAHAPHIATSEEFRRNLVVKEIEDYKVRKKKKVYEKSLQSFKQELMDRDVTFESDVEGTVKIQFKEVFNKMKLRRADEQTSATFDAKAGGIIEKDRQNFFIQVIVDYMEMIVVGADDLNEGQAFANEAMTKLRDDILTVFREAVRKQLFHYGTGAEYSIRLIVPLLKADGTIPDSYKNLKGQETRGYGYSTSRQEIRSELDLYDLIDEIFLGSDDRSGLLKVLHRYVSVNHSSGFAIAGFMIEKMVK